MLKSKILIISTIILSFLLVGCSNNSTNGNTSQNTNTRSNPTTKISGNSRTGQEVNLSTGTGGNGSTELSYEMIYSGKRRR